MVRVGGEDLYHVDEELSLVAEKIDEEERGDEEDVLDLQEVDGSECLWRDGERESEGDLEEWINRVADEVKEKNWRRCVC